MDSSTLDSVGKIEIGLKFFMLSLLPFFVGIIFAIFITVGNVPSAKHLLIRRVNGSAMVMIIFLRITLLCP